MTEFFSYPKWVRGQIAQDAEDEARIDREWHAENPDATPPTAVDDDKGIAPTDVSQSPTPASDEAPQ